MKINFVHIGLLLFLFLVANLITPQIASAFSFGSIAKAVTKGISDTTQTLKKAANDTVDEVSRVAKNNKKVLSEIANGNQGLINIGKEAFAKAFKNNQKTFSNAIDFVTGLSKKTVDASLNAIKETSQSKKPNSSLLEKLEKLRETQKAIDEAEKTKKALEQKNSLASALKNTFSAINDALEKMQQKLDEKLAKVEQEIQDIKNQQKPTPAQNENLDSTESEKPVPEQISPNAGGKTRLDFEEAEEMVRQRVEQAAIAFNENIPVSVDEISDFKRLKARKLIAALQKSLSKIKAVNDNDEPINGLTIFSQIYGCSFSSFQEELLISYDYTNSPSDRWWYHENYMKLVPDGADKPPTLDSLKKIEASYQFFKQDLPIVDLVYKFMQKSIDYGSLCGYPPNYISDAALVLHFAWINHSVEWKEIKDIESYRRSQEWVRQALSFWFTTYDRKKEYFTEFLRIAQIQDAEAFHQILLNVYNLTLQFDKKLAEVQEQALAETSTASAPQQVQPEKQKLTTRLVVNRNNEYRPQAYGSTSFYYSYLELVFDANELAASWPTTKRPLREQWHKKWFRLEIGFARVGDEILVLIPERIRPYSDPTERSGRNFYVRNTYDLTFSLSSNGKQVYVKSSADPVRVVVNTTLGGQVYNRTHSVPFTEAAQGMISIPLSKLK